MATEEEERVMVAAVRNRAHTGEGQLEHLPSDMDRFRQLCCAVRMAGDDATFRGMTQATSMAFKRQAMQDVLAEKDARPWPEGSDEIEKMQWVSGEYINRQAHGYTGVKGTDSYFKLNDRLKSIVETTRHSVMKQVVIDILVWLPSLGKMKKREPCEFVGVLLDATSYPPHWLNMGWPEGLWTPVHLALFEHKRLQFAFSWTTRAWAIDAQVHWPVNLIESIAGMDSVPYLKRWVKRANKTGDWDNEDGVGPFGVIVYLILAHGAVKCFKHMCEVGPNFVLGFDTRQLMTWCSERARQTTQYAFWSDAMFIAVYDKCGCKMEIEKPARTHIWRQRYVQLILWGKVRQLVKLIPYALHWQEDVAKANGLAEFDEDGNAMMLGDHARSDLVEAARARGVVLEEREKQRRFNRVRAERMAWLDKLAIKRQTNVLRDEDTDDEDEKEGPHKQHAPPATLAPMEVAQPVPDATLDNDEEWVESEDEDLEPSSKRGRE